MGVNDNTNDVKEKNAVTFVSSSSEEETKEHWPPSLLSLGDVMLDPDPDHLYNTNK